MEDKTKARVDELRAQVKAARGISLHELADLRATAQAQGGELVAVTAADDDGEYCGTGRFHFKLPPRGGSIGPFIDAIIKYGVGGHIIINGIPVPHEILVDVSKVVR
jgi:hypothetical protein